MVTKPAPHRPEFRTISSVNPPRDVPERNGWAWWFGPDDTFCAFHARTEHLICARSYEAMIFAIDCA